MKVKKMIEILSKMNPNAEVKMDSPEGNSIIFVLASKKKEGVVWMQTQDSCDISNEIVERFNYASEEQMDELEFYTDLIDTGFNIEMVENAMGKDVAEHMRKFCIDHGLIDETN